MKKTVKLVVSVFMIVSLFMTSLALVSFAASPKLTMTTGTTSNGQTELIVTVSKGSDLATIQAALKYESDKVKLMSVEYLSGDKNVSNTETQGVALVNDVWIEKGLSDETQIIRFVFSGTADTETTFSLEDIKATDSNDQPINFKPVTAKVKVKANTPDQATDPSGSGSGSQGGSSGNIPGGSTNGTSPNTGKIIASAAGICAAALAAAAVVLIIKKKNGKEE